MRTTVTQTAERSADLSALDEAANDAAAMLKSMSNPSRLRLLCALVEGPMTVGELEQALGCSQSYVSGQLARLRAEGLVARDREGRSQLYRLGDPRTKPVLEALYSVFCPTP